MQVVENIATKFQNHGLTLKHGIKWKIKIGNERGNLRQWFQQTFFCYCC